MTEFPWNRRSLSVEPATWRGSASHERAHVSRTLASTGRRGGVEGMCGWGGGHPDLATAGLALAYGQNYRPCLSNSALIWTVGVVVGEAGFSTMVFEVGFVFVHHTRGPRTNRARSRRSISNGVMHLIPRPMHASGILILRVEAEGTSCVTTVC
jgi:hypothetical protein